MGVGTERSFSSAFASVPDGAGSTSTRASRVIEYSAATDDPSEDCDSWAQGREPPGTVSSMRRGQSAGAMPAGSTSTEDMSENETVRGASVWWSLSAVSDNVATLPEPVTT